MNAKILAALERLQWSEIIDRKKQLGRCPVCQRLESEGQHARDCYIGQALDSVGGGEQMVFLVSDNGSTTKLQRSVPKAIVSAMVNSTLPPAQMIVERRVFVEVGGKRVHVWDHDNDRSTRYAPAGRRLLELIETINLSAVAEPQPMRYFKWMGKQACEYAFFSVDESSVIAYGHDMQPNATPLTPGDIALCQAEGKMVEIERPPELPQAA